MGHVWRLDPAHPPPQDPRFPACSAMAVLLAVATGRQLEVGDLHGEDVIAFTDPKDPAAAVLVDGADLDELEAKGWLRIEAGGAVATEAGRYWLAKWVTYHRKALGVPRGTRVEDLFVRGEAS